jgi:hypothetical protein
VVIWHLHFPINFPENAKLWRNSQLTKQPRALPRFQESQNCFIISQLYFFLQRLDLNDHFRSNHPDRKQQGVCIQCLKLIPAIKMKYHIYFKHQYTQKVSQLNGRSSLCYMELADFTFRKLPVPQSDFAKRFIRFFKIKMWICWNKLILIYFQTYFWGWICCTVVEECSLGWRVRYKCW